MRDFIIESSEEDFNDLFIKTDDDNFKSKESVIQSFLSIFDMVKEYHSKLEDVNVDIVCMYGRYNLVVVLTSEYHHNWEQYVNFINYN
jgi:aminopeptidase-like protein